MREFTPLVSERLHFSEKFGFGAFSGSINIVYQFKSLYYLFFLTNVVKVPVLAAGTILTVGILWDAVNDPLLGFWAVNRKFKTGERVRPYAFWFSIPWAVTVVLLFCYFYTPPPLTIAIAVITYIIFEVFNTLVGIPYNSMAGLATNVDSERRSINVYRNFGACVGSGVGAVSCLPLLRLFGAMDKSGNLRADTALRGFLLTAALMGALIIAGSLIHYFTTKERVTSSAKEEPYMSAREILRMLFSCRSWVFNALYLICYGVINVLLLTCVTYYATYVIGSTSSATLIQAVYLAASVGASFLVGPLDRALGRRKTMIAGCLFALCGKAWFLVNPFSLGAIYLNALTIGVSVTIAFVMFNTNRNNIVDIIEWKSGRRLDSMVSTADNFASKLAMAGAAQVITLLLASAGYNADLASQGERVIGAINFMLGWLPEAVSAVMLLTAVFIPIEEDMRAIQRGT